MYNLYLMRKVLEEILTLQADDDGDVILFTDENGFNPIIHAVGEALGASQPLQIEVFPMDIDGGIAEKHDDVDHWDVLLRPDGGDPIAEFAGLTLDAANEKAAELLEKYPFAAVNNDLESLLR